MFRLQLRCTMHWPPAVFRLTQNCVASSADRERSDLRAVVVPLARRDRRGGSRRCGRPARPGYFDCSMRNDDCASASLRCDEPAPNSCRSAAGRRARGGGADWIAGGWDGARRRRGSGCAGAEPAGRRRPCGCAAAAPAWSGRIVTVLTGFGSPRPRSAVGAPARERRQDAPGPERAGEPPGGTGRRRSRIDRLLLARHHALAAAVADAILDLLAALAVAAARPERSWWASVGLDHRRLAACWRPDRSRRDSRTQPRCRSPQAPPPPRRHQAAAPLPAGGAS